IPVGGASSRLALSGMAVVFYLSKILIPFGLLPIYPRWEIEPPRAWQFVPWVLVAAGVAWAWTRRDAWGRHVLFAFGFFLLIVFPVLGFITISWMRITWVADHFVYLPMISIVALVAAAATEWYRRLPVERRAAAALVVALLAAASHRYSAAWVSERQMWTHTLAGNPDAWQAHNRLGAVLVRDGDVDGAYEHFVASSRLRPDLGETHNNRGQTLAMKGRIDEAIEAFETAMAASPQILVIHLNLANAYAARNRMADAERLLRALIDREPEMLPARARWADVLAVLQRFDEAAAQYRIVLKKVPRNAVLWNNCGACLLRLSRRDDAAECFRRALALQPDLADARNNLDQLEKAARSAPPAAR
ncbi:MAG: tetratricopeptide repeat protein, partial [Planctomycetes bacterium]|nr:tetratricopeptide repeat protein [Planctomycetota bacterium]